MINGPINVNPAGTVRCTTSTRSGSVQQLVTPYVMESDQLPTGLLRTVKLALFSKVLCITAA